MKSTLSLISMPALSFSPRWRYRSTVANAQTYTITDLGPADNPFSQASGLNDYGLVTGVATAPDGSQHAVIWLNGA